MQKRPVTHTALINEVCQRLNRNIDKEEWGSIFGDQEYQITCGNLPANSSIFALNVQDAALNDKSGDLISSYQNLRQQYPHSDVHPSVLGELCKYGGLKGYARTVLSICDEAVSKEPYDGRHLDSRALAYAMVGDFSRAAEEFRAYVEWVKQQPLDSNETGSRDRAKYIAEREFWIQELLSGRNPFDKKVLESIEEEY
jgi:hypothetical protein